MAVPVRKMSHSNTRHRRAQWKATTPQLVTITADGAPYRVRTPRNSSSSEPSWTRSHCGRP
ncbi:50S ribosomal protein L32 [Streptomyces sp. NPDC019645]|uniref:50S ribosomal protein L32 n=1 Tax=Streptomyces sp. NPDC019645 TaxID=3154786 RepID=UPI0033D5934D